MVKQKQFISKIRKLKRERESLIKRDVKNGKNKTCS